MIFPSPLIIAQTLLVHATLQVSAFAAPPKAMLKKSKDSPPEITRMTAPHFKSAELRMIYCQIK
jgi:hypothetical protein